MLAGHAGHGQHSQRYGSPGEIGNALRDSPGEQLKCGNATLNQWLIVRNIYIKNNNKKNDRASSPESLEVLKNVLA